MIQHHGIIVDDPEAYQLPKIPQREWPDGFVSYGDSFLVWGEHRQHEDDEPDFTLHVIYEGPMSFAEARHSLSHVLILGERLVDYVCESERKDWSEGQHTYTLEHFT